MEGKRVESLHELMLRLEEAGVLTYTDYGTYFKATFNRIGAWSDLADAKKIKFYNEGDDFAPDVDIIAGTCGSYTDVYVGTRGVFGEADEPEDDIPF